ncbi:MAG: YcxB family protein [Clostridia bacterium]|nr:YcxB family protein [Clostridia bacterium]
MSEQTTRSENEELQQNAAINKEKKKKKELITDPSLPGIHCRVNLTADLFRRFAMYDTFVKQRRYFLPLGFCAIMLFFATVAFLAKDKPQHILIGSILTVVGLSLPLTYWLTYRSSLKGIIKANKFPKDVYELRLTEEKDGLKIHSLTNTKEQAAYKWEQVFRAVRTKGCIYLYPAPIKAFLLPDGQADVSPDELWAFLKKVLPEAKLKEYKTK